MNSQNNFYRPFGRVAMVCVGLLAMDFIAPATHAEEVNAEVEVMTRGPVHEAFAEAVSYEAQPGVIVSMKVPDAIEEMPPDEQPDGDNVTWISGYWAWDDDQNNFIWVSGIWRNLPPGRQWVPGYWSDLNDGRFQWTSGYWAGTERTSVSYIRTAPPASIDTGPNIAAPSADHSWIPGNWYWSETRYVWRPGYWLALRPNWCWMPAHYSWTPGGYIYVGGYWDHAVATRGVLFAPVYFRRPVYTVAAYSFVPAVVISLNVFSDHLFYRPHGHHYYFGDYYAPRYREAGFYASYTWTSGRHGYDPIYSYNRWEHRGDPNWERRRYQDFEYFRDHEDARPPRTWTAMRDARADQFNDGRNRRFASSLSGYAQQEKGTRFRKIDDKRRSEMVSQNREIRKFSQERRQIESRKTDDASNDGKTARREELKHSPIKSREASELAANDTPPPKQAQNHGKKANTSPDGRAEPGKGKTNQGPADQGRGNKGRDEQGRAEPGKGKTNQDPADQGRGNKGRDEQGQGRGKPTNPDATPSKSIPKAREDAVPAPRKESRPNKERSPEAQPTQPKPSRIPDRPQNQEPIREKPKAKPRSEESQGPRTAPQQDKKRKAEDAPHVNRPRSSNNSPEKAVAQRRPAPAKREVQPNSNANRMAANAPRRSKDVNRPSLAPNQGRQSRGAANDTPRNRDGESQTADNGNGGGKKDKKRDE